MAATCNSTVQGRIWPNFRPIQDFMDVLVACKNEEDPIKNESNRVVTSLFIDFSDAQGSNSSKLLRLVLLPARMKKIHQKMKAQEWSQHFSYYKSMGTFPDAQGQLTHKSLARSCRISDSSKLLWLFLLHERMKKIQSKMCIVLYVKT